MTAASHSSAEAATEPLMRLVRARAEAYRALDAAGGLILPDPLAPMTRPAPPAPVPRHPMVHAHELLALEGPDLVRSSYQRILWRNAQPEEVVWRSDLLRSGVLSPLELLVDLSSSAEGQLCKVTIEGLDQKWPWSLALRLAWIRKSRVWADKLGLSDLRKAVQRWLVEQRVRTDRHDAALQGLLGATVDTDPAASAAALRRRIAALEARLAELERRVVGK